MVCSHKWHTAWITASWRSSCWQRRSSGHLRITAPAGFGRRHVAPLVPRFRELHPDVSISLNLSDRVVDLAAEGFDCAVRVGDLPDSSLVSVRMADNRRLASFIGHKGRLPVHEVLSWQGGPAPADSASASVVEHLQSVMRLTPGAALPKGPVLLVACEVRSRWSASMAATLLREHGAEKVLLLGLHQLA